MKIDKKQLLVETLAKRKEEFFDLPMLIKAQRTSLNELQKTFGQALGVDQTTVSRWESGDYIPSYPVLATIQWRWIEQLVKELIRKAKILKKIEELEAKAEELKAEAERL